VLPNARGRQLEKLIKLFVGVDAHDKLLQLLPNLGSTTP
jgi:hypothetical protein